MRVILLFFLLIMTFLGYGQTVVVNEIMASNSSTVKDNKDKYSDWIELRNLTGSDYDLANHYISDKKKNKTKFRFTSSAGKVVVPANGYLLIWATGRPEDGDNHTSFSLSATDGESVVLTMPDGSTVIDQIDFPPLEPDVSYGRNSTGNWVEFTPASPGAENKDNDTKLGNLDVPVFSKKGGVYTSSFNLLLSHTDPSVTIYYTLDGSDPDPENVGGTTFMYKNESGEEAAELYENVETFIFGSSIYINDRSSQENKVSMKSSSVVGDELNFYFPESKITKGTVVRAIAYKPGYKSDISTNTYFIFSNKNKYSLPIVSVSMNEELLFGFDKGFYTYGVNYQTKSSGCHYGNYYLDWEHSGNFEYFTDGNQQISKKITYKVHGGCSRTFPIKSLRVMGGGKLDFPFFGNVPERIHRNILLRNGGNNWDTNMFKDAVIHQFMEGLNFGRQEVVPVIVFMNGEYWGIQNLRERVDEHYLKELYGVDKNKVDIIKFSQGYEASEGDMNSFNQMYSFLRNNNFNIQSNYDSLKNLIDIKSFIDYQLAETYINNSDWPFNNVRLWRYKRDSSDPETEGVEDGRWRWLFHDADKTVGHAYNNIGKDLGQSTEFALIFEKIYQNEEFRKEFVNRYADIINTNFKPSRTVSMISDFETIFNQEIAEHRERWSVPTVENWSFWINDMKDFYTLRPDAHREHINDFFDGGSVRELTVDLSNSESGYISVNTIDIIETTVGIDPNPYPWNGKYFENYPVTLKINPKPEKAFLYWTRDGGYYSSNKTIVVTLDSDHTFKAVFEGDVEDYFPVAHLLDGCGYKFNYWPADSPKGSFPDNGAFVYWTEIEDPQDWQINETLGYTDGVYNLSAGTRINGLGNGGVSFANSSSSNSGYKAGSLGGYLMAINTQNVQNVKIEWTAKTISSKSMKYNLRLLYRVGTSNWFVVLGPVYQSGTDNDSQTFKDIVLPANAMGKEYVQLLWQYYYTGVGSGSRDELAISDINIYEMMVRPGNSQSVSYPDMPGEILSSETLYSGNNRVDMASKFIELGPGFEAKPGSVYKAEIRSCP